MVVDNNHDNIDSIIICAAICAVSGTNLRNLILSVSMDHSNLWCLLAEGWNYLDGVGRWTWVIGKLVSRKFVKPKNHLYVSTWSGIIYSVYIVVLITIFPACIKIPIHISIYLNQYNFQI